MITAKIKTLLPVVIEIECPECGHTEQVAANGWTAIVCRGCKVELEHPHPHLFEEEFVLSLLLREMCADDQIQLLIQQRNGLAAIIKTIYKDNPEDLTIMLDAVFDSQDA